MGEILTKVAKVQYATVIIKLQLKNFMTNTMTSSNDKQQCTLKITSFRSKARPAKLWELSY